MNDFAEYLSTRPKSPLTEAIAALYESASSILYHFMTANRLCQLLETNRFTPSDNEQRYNGEGKRFMSFSRHGNFNEGYPSMLYSKYGLGDYWCKIRLTIDGDKFNRQPNFHTDDRKQHSTQFKPFDWVHNVYKGTPMAKQYPNGRSFPASYDSDPMVDYATLKPVTNASHPFFQTEDRMTTDAAYIPNALSYILRIDIILYINDFDRHNQKTRERLYNAINNVDTDKIHIYNGMEQFNNKIECSRSVLTAPCDNRAIKDTQRYRKTDGSINYEYRTYPRAVTEAANINIDDDLAAKFATTSQDIYKATVWVADKINEFGDDFIKYLMPRLDDPTSQYNATLSFNFSEMNLSEDFLKGVPQKLYIRFVKPEHSMMYPKGDTVAAYAYTDTAGLIADLDDGWPEYALIGIYVHPNMDNTDIISRVIKMKLPHELRHVVDTCDKATLQMMTDSLQNNVMAFASSDFARYWDDPGEYYARLSEVVVFAMHVLSNPNNRAKVHSAKEVIEKLSAKSSAYRQALGDVDDTAKQMFNKNLEAILAKVMDKLI